jgi:hypothetical protein
VTRFKRGTFDYGECGGFMSYDVYIMSYLGWVLSYIFSVSRGFMYSGKWY